jgi:LysM repeat protein
MAIAGIFKNAIASEVGNTFTSVYTAPMTPTAQTSYLIECDIACTGDSGVQISVKLTKADASFAYVVKNAPVPVGSAIQVIDGQKIVLMPGDSLDVKCETPGNTVDVILSLVEDVNI